MLSVQFSAIQIICEKKQKKHMLSVCNEERMEMTLRQTNISDHCSTDVL